MHCDGARSKPSKEITLGTSISLRQGFDDKTVIVKAFQTSERARRRLSCSTKKLQRVLNAAKPGGRAQAQPTTGLLPRGPTKTKKNDSALQTRRRRLSYNDP